MARQFLKRIDELMDRTPIVMAEAAPAQPATAQPRPGRASKNLSESKNGQGADMGADIRACVADDKSPAGRHSGWPQEDGKRNSFRYRMPLGADSCEVIRKRMMTKMMKT